MCSENFVSRAFADTLNPVEDFRPTPAHFKNSLELIGTEAFSVSVAGIVVRFEGISSSMVERATLQYQPFLSTEAPLNVVRLTKGRDTYLLPERLLRLEQASFDDREVMTSPEFAAFRSSHKTGMLRISRPEDVDCVLRSMETYLRWIVASLAIQRDAFILHSAGLVHSGLAYIFCGHSGAGKSTVTALSPARMYSPMIWS